MSETTTIAQPVDSLTLGVIWRGLEAAANDAGTTLQQTAYSEVVREARDFSVGMFDHKARMIAQGDFSAGHLHSMPNAVRHMLDYYPVEDLQPGDALMLNDSWMGSGHLNDFFLVSPAFIGDRIVGYTVCCVHMIDVGGMVPGSQAVAGITEHYQEGIRFLPVRVWRAGEPNREILRTLEANTRVPVKVIGDLKGMRNCNRIGEQRLVSLIEQFGLETYEAACDTILERSEAAMREAIREIPDGVYHAVDYFDDYGPDTEPLRLEATVTIEDDEITIDFAGSSPQTPSGINGIEQWVRAWCFFTVKVLTQGGSIPQNAGCLRPVHWKAPPGSFVNTQPPAGSGSRAIMVQRLVDVLMTALAEAVPERVQAASCQWANPVVGGLDPRTGRRFVLYDAIIGGFGALSHKDGTEAMSPTFNLNTIPVEVFEHEFPVVFQRYELVRDGAGAGRFRGGHPIRKDMRLTGEDMELMNLTDRQAFPAPGLFGGEAGQVGRTILISGDGERVLHSKGRYRIATGDVVSSRLSGAGGYGDPLAREPERVAADVLAGLLSVEKAAESYGVILDEEANIDLPATRARRAREAALRADNA